MAHALRYYVTDKDNVVNTGNDDVGILSDNGGGESRSRGAGERHGGVGRNDDGGHDVPSFLMTMLLAPPTSVSVAGAAAGAAAGATAAETWGITGETVRGQSASWGSYPLPSRSELQDMVHEHGQLNPIDDGNSDSDGDDSDDQGEVQHRHLKGSGVAGSGLYPNDLLRTNVTALRAKLRGVPYVAALDFDPHGFTDMGSGSAHSGDNLPLDALHEEDPLKLARAYCRAAEVPEWVSEVMMERRNVDMMVKSLAWHRGFANGASVVPTSKGVCRRLLRALRFLLGF
jgi:ribosomal protein L39E